MTNGKRKLVYFDTTVIVLVRFKANSPRCKIYIRISVRETGLRDVKDSEHKVVVLS